MASPSTPTHGKLAAIYRWRPNGFKGNGLNDVTWGTGYSAADSAYFEVVIDAEGTPDTFKWRKDGGGWTTGVSITGAAQTLSDSQTITFAATTGHTLTDQWVIGNLFAEPTTESSAAAQITDTTMRRINPNTPPTWSDTGSEIVLKTEFATGTAHFTGNVTVVTVAGNNGWIPDTALEKMGYLFDWSLDLSVDLADISRMGQQWKESIPGAAGGSGSANAYFIGTDTLYEDFLDGVDGTQDYFLLQLFNYDPDQDQTGDHWSCWVIFEGLSVSAPVNEVIKEAVAFQVQGLPGWVANS